MNRLNLAVLSVLASMFAAVPAYAVIDVADITDKVTEVEVAAGLIGVAVLVMFFGIKAYKWLRGAG